MKIALVAAVATLIFGFVGFDSQSRAAGEEAVTTVNDAQAGPRKLEEGNAACFGCHTAEGLAKQTPPPAGLKRLRSLQIDGAKFESSVHGGVACQECHGDGVSTVPHQGGFRDTVDTCPTCHKAFKKNIVPEMAKGVHAQRIGERFNCYSCHDPHNVRKAASLGSTRNLALRDNTMCRDCHESDEQFAAYSDKPRPNLQKAHSWQPNPQVHWTAVRCIDCHTPEKPNAGISHEILPKEKAERYCVDCHSTNSSLLTRLYRYQVSEERVTEAGFINAYVLTQAYVLGVTRNAYLDWTSLILFVGVAAGLAGHGLLRYVGVMARKGRK